MNSLIKNMQNLISAERLRGYDDSIAKHSKNLNLISCITPNMAMIEISIRNIVDFYISQKERPDWILNPINDDIKNEKEAIEKRYKKQIAIQHKQYLSNLSFGKIISLALYKKYNLENEIFTNLQSLDFKKYSKTNKNFYIINNKKNKFDNIQKARILLNLLLIIRNRSYHWGNLLKTRVGRYNQKYPRITTTHQGAHIGIDPSSIEVFLSDVFNRFILQKDI